MNELIKFVIENNWIISLFLALVAIIQSATSYNLARNVFELEVSRMISDSLNSLSNAETSAIVGLNGYDDLSCNLRKGYPEAIFEYLNVLNQACFFRSKKKISRRFFNNIVMFRIKDVFGKKDYIALLDSNIHKHLYRIYQSNFQNSDNE